jgi:hypothetical protein
MRILNQMFNFFFTIIKRKYDLFEVISLLIILGNMFFYLV